MRKIHKVLKNKNLEYYEGTDWTPAAVDCYKNRFDCKNCIIFATLGNKCKMKKSIIGLINKEGIPEEFQRGNSDILD